jgi:lysophospholipase L1-like esterase
MQYKNYFFNRWSLYLALGSIFLLIGVASMTKESFLNSTKTPTVGKADTSTVRYLPLGDSYTIGQGTEVTKNFPHQLSKSLESKGITLAIVAEPARTGFTTQDMIDQELPLVAKLSPDLVTVLIGVNDWVQGVSKEQYQINVQIILDTLLKHISAERIIVVAIPDFSLTPSGSDYTTGRNGSAGIAEFNNIMRDSAQTRDIEFVDIFVLSQEQARIRSEKTLAPDGLHYSASGYQEWLQHILPTTEKALVNQFLQQ